MSAGTTMPPSGRDAGQDAPRPGRELAVEDLALDLQPDQQEEHRHQGVVDPVVDGLAQSNRSDPDLAGGSQQRLVVRPEGRIGDDESRDSGEA